MKPDLDDFDDYANEHESPRSRAMSWVVLAVALSGFVALAWYAYHSGSESIQDGSMVVIKADESPIKEKPVDAGGEEFPHQDKTIYDTISPYRAKEETKVEKLLPEAEEPMIEESDTKTWVNDKLREESDAEEKINAQLETHVTEDKKQEAKPIAKEELKPVAAPVVEAKKEETPAPEPVVEVKKEEPKKVEAPKPAPAPIVSSGSGFKVQLGAYASQAEAEQNWARISSKHAAALSGHPHVIVKADVSGKTYYRLRAAGFATADNAKQACAKITAAGQACFFAGK